MIPGVENTGLYDDDYDTCLYNHERILRPFAVDENA